MHILAFFLWYNPLYGEGYQFWSGIGSDFGELTICGFLWHHVTCEEKGCWRLGHPGRAHKCRKHIKQEAS